MTVYGKERPSQRGRDWPSLAAASALMLLIALAAGFVPARRATRTDPAVTLRQE